MKKVIKFLKSEWNSLMYKLMFKKERKLSGKQNKPK